MVKNKKGAIEINSLIGILLVIIVLVILLTSTGLYKKILKGSAEDVLCEASFIVSAMSRPLITIGNPIVSPECEVNKILIVNKEVKQEETNGASMQAVLDTDYPSTIPDQAWDTFLRVKNWNDKCGDKKPLPESAKYLYFDEYAKEIGTSGRKPINPKSATTDQKDYVQKRYNMDKIFADEMKRCWNIVGKGQLPLFDTWYEFFKCNYNGQEKPCESSKDYFSKGISGSQTAAVFCVLCSRIKFDSEVSKEFKGTDNDKYISLNRWMANNPRQVSDDQSYYEYILDESQAGSIFSFPKFEYSTDKPYAVVFTRVNMNGLPNIVVKGYDWLLNPGKDTETNANVLMIIPYEELSQTCDYLVASTV